MNYRLHQEILETGIGFIDLLAPYLKGGKVGLFGGAGVGKTAEAAHEKRTKTRCA